MSKARTLTLYSKPGCHLCDDLRVLLDELRPDYGFTVEEINITCDLDLFARYRLAIPVLLIDGVEVARGLVDERDLVARLKRSG